MSAAELLKGVWYAFEQCGHLLDHAMTLYGRGAYPSAVGLGLLAREEMGKARIWLKLWEDAERQGRTVTVKEAQRVVEDHFTKQQSALVSLTQRGYIGTQFGSLLADAIAEDPLHLEVPAEARRELDEITARRRKRIPRERQGHREQAFYVDASDTGWRRPVEVFSELEARDVLTDVRNDYSVQREKLMRAFEENPKLVGVLGVWSDRPPLPESRGPWEG